MTNSVNTEKQDLKKKKKPLGKLEIERNFLNVIKDFYKYPQQISHLLVKYGKCPT